MRASDEVDELAAGAKWSSAERLQFWIYLILLDRIVGAEFDDSSDGFFFLYPPVVAVALGNSEFVCFFGESGIGIVLTEQNAVFGSGGKHAVWFVNSLCGEIIDEYADITLIAVHLECFVANTMQGCVDSGHGSLSSCFLIAGSSVHLSGKEETFDDFRLQ